MNLLIVGQKWFAAELLRRCLDAGHSVAAVVAPRAGDRLAVLAAELAVPRIIATRRLDAAQVPPGVDLICAAHAHCYITPGARSSARLGAIGYHPSLLPRHRGRDAIRWTLHMREQVAGGSIYWLDDGADTGPVAMQAWCHVQPGDDAATLWRRDLAPMGLRLMVDAVRLAEAGKLPSQPQDDALATWEPSFSGVRLSSA